MWLATGMMPVMMDRGVKEVDGARVMQRPSKKAYALGVEDVREVEELQPGSFDGNTSNWASTDPMPDEPNECDVGWMPGPIDRKLFPFRGATPGPADSSLNSESTPTDVMNGLLTNELLDLIAEAGKDHCRAYRAQKGITSKKTLKASKDKPQIALGFKLSIVDRRLVSLWLSAKDHGCNPSTRQP